MRTDWQTLWTLIRLFEKQSDLGLHCLLIYWGLNIVFGVKKEAGIKMTITNEGDAEMF